MKVLDAFRYRSFVESKSKTLHCIIQNTAFSDDEIFSRKSNQSYMLIIFSQTHQNIRNEYLKAHKMNFECVRKRVEYDYISNRE